MPIKRQKPVDRVLLWRTVEEMQLRTRFPERLETFILEAIMVHREHGETAEDTFIRLMKYAELKMQDFEKGN